MITVFMWVLYWNFARKLLVLLSLECIMVFSINMSFFYFGFTSFFIFLAIILSLFMVLDSVLGLSLLLGFVRSSSFVSVSRYTL